MHLGLEGFLPLPLYLAGIAAVLLAAFKRSVFGLYYLTPLIPLQTLRYSLNGFPLGQSVVDIVLVSVIVGLLRERRSIRPRTPLDLVVFAYGGYTLISLFWGSFSMNLPMPLSPADPRLAGWKNLFEMPVIMYLVASAVRNEKEMLVLLGLMCFAVFQLDRSYWGIVSSRDFSQYSNELRDEGGMGYAGVNGLAAFEASLVTMLLGFNAFKHRLRLRLACFGLAVFSVICLMYSLSRGGYAAFLVGWIFIGVVQQRKLLVLFGLFLFTWTAVVPNAVRERVFMTYDADRGLDRTSMQRVRLWDDALVVARTNPLLGTGFDTYAYMGRVGTWNDTHNIYLKVVVETGFIGLALFLGILWKFFRIGWTAFRISREPLVQGLGLGLCGWIVSTAVANFFSDAWTYLQVDGYLWMLAGLVCRALILEQEKRAQVQSFSPVTDGGIPGAPELSPAGVTA
jgi:O-antigen ligase